MTTDCPSITTTNELFTALFNRFSSTPVFGLDTDALKVWLPALKLAVGSVMVVDCHCAKVPIQLYDKIFAACAVVVVM